MKTFMLTGLVLLTHTLYSQEIKTEKNNKKDESSVESRVVEMLDSPVKYTKNTNFEMATDFLKSEVSTNNELRSFQNKDFIINKSSENIPTKTSETSQKNPATKTQKNSKSGQTFYIGYVSPMEGFGYAHAIGISAGFYTIPASTPGLSFFISSDNIYYLVKSAPISYSLQGGINIRLGANSGAYIGGGAMVTTMSLKYYDSYNISRTRHTWGGGVSAHLGFKAIRLGMILPDFNGIPMFSLGFSSSPFK